MADKGDIQESGKRGMILAAALMIFSEKGFHGSTIEEIAEEAGVGKGTVYLYFESKTDLFVSLVEERLRELKEIVVKHLEGLEGAGEKLTESIKLHWKFFNQSKEFVRVILSDLGGLGKELDERTRDARVRFIEVFESIIKEGTETGEFKEIQPRMAAYAIEGAISFVAFENLINSQGFPSISDPSQLVDFCLNGLCRREGKGEARCFPDKYKIESSESEG
ncbi:MAG: TetR/AcrR family transcriptional regulator [Firmicutes bacterium]|nr:TetR/AcrR family transcriptional regulator [Bacillota bacterium]